MAEESYDTKSAQEFVDIQEKIRDLDEAILGTVLKLNKQRKDELIVEDKLLDKLEDQTKQLADQAFQQFKKGKLSQAEAISINKTLMASFKFIANQKVINKEMKKKNGLAASLLLTLGQLPTEIDKFLDMLPGGQALTRLFGINKLKQALDNATDAAMQGLAKALKANKPPMDALVRGGAEFIKQIGFMKLAIFGVIAAIGLAVAAGMKQTKQAKETAAATGLSVAQSVALVKQSRAVQMEGANQLATQKEVLGILQGVANETNGIVTLSNEAAAQFAQLTNELGISGLEAGNLAATLMTITGVSGEGAIENAKAADELARASGVAPGKVLKDITANAKTQAKFFAGNAKLLREQAVQAAKIGASLQQVGLTATALLDIENSLTKQFELQAYTGKEINADRARQLAFAGKTAEAAQVLIEEMGELPDDPLGMQMAADLAGISVAELQKQKTLMDDMKNMSAEQLLAKQKEEEANKAGAEAQERIAAAIDKIVNALSSTLVPIFEFLGENINGILVALSAAAGLFISMAVQAAAIAAYEKSVMIYKTVQAALQKKITKDKKVGLMTQIKDTMAAIAGAIAEVTGASAATLGIAAGVALAAGAAAAALLYGYMDDGVQGPVKAGYSRTLTGPEGSIAINDKDTAIFGTNLGGGGGTTESITTQTDTGGSTAALKPLFNQMIALLTKISNNSETPPPIEINGQVISAIGAGISEQDSYL